MSDRLVKIVDSKGNTAGYTFDVESNLSSFTENLNGLDYTTSYTYDKENKPKTTSYKDKVITNNYDVLGRLQGKVTNTGTAQFNTSYEFEAGKGASDTNNSTTNRVSKITNNGKDIVYSYDKNGYMETITENGKVIKYFYNELNELTREEYYNNAILEKTITYSYDNGGNILNKVEIVGVTNTTTTYAYGDANWKDKLTSFDGKAITYDAIGNPLSYDGYTYAWEEGRQLAGMTGNSKTITYKYNDSGIRTQKTVNGVTTTYHLVGDKVTFETNGTDNIYYTYDASDSLVSMNLNGVEYYYIRNNQGDIIGLHDSAGAEVVSYSYDSWGKLISTTGTLASSVGVKNPYRYRGYRYDAETSLYYLQSRYYNVDWGRFVNGDDTRLLPLTQDGLLRANLFIYSGNNPVNNFDPSGYWWGGNAWNWVKSNWKGIPNRLFAIAIDSAITIYTGGTAIAGIKSIRKLLRENRTNITRIIEREIMKKVGSVTSTIVGTIFNLALTATGASVGGIIVSVIDNYIDPMYGAKKGNGYCFG